MTCPLGFFLNMAPNPVLTILVSVFIPFLVSSAKYWVFSFSYRLHKGKGRAYFDSLDFIFEEISYFLIIRFYLITYMGFLNPSLYLIRCLHILWVRWVMVTDFPKSLAFPKNCLSSCEILGFKSCWFYLYYSYPSSSSSRNSPSKSVLSIECLPSLVLSITQSTPSVNKQTPTLFFLYQLCAFLIRRRFFVKTFKVSECRESLSVILTSLRPVLRVCFFLLQAISLQELFHILVPTHL